MPATPLIAILAAELVHQILLQASRKSFTIPSPIHRRSPDAARIACGLLIAGLIVGLMSRYVGQFYQHHVMPPHKVSSAAHREVQVRGLSNAVVAMPLEEKRPPLDPRAGIVFMTVPFETNPVIYVRAVPQWKEKAAECYPERTLYEICADTKDGKGFRVK